ncbi:MAG: hypothetical protein Q9222_003302 [Ikaeria aurantiellina]
MMKRNCYLSSYVSAPPSDTISSQVFHLVHVSLTVLAILLFSIGVGITTKYGPPGSGYCTQLALGILFFPITWTFFCAVSHVSKTPRLRPRYNVAYDLYIGESVLTGIIIATRLSTVVSGYHEDVTCDGSKNLVAPGASGLCIPQAPPIMHLDMLAFKVAFIIRALHSVHRMRVIRQ